MKTGKIRVFAFVCVLLALGAIQLWASDRVGVYGIVEKIVFEPNETSPQRVQIWGAFAVTDGKSGSGYLPPQRGYLYYTITPGKEEIAKKEWADLKAVAGTGQGIGFGFRYETKVRVRKATEKVESPDTYVVSQGLVKIGPPHDNAAILPGLKEALRKQ